MKKMFKNINYIILFSILMLNISEGVMDYDYYWQIIFGKEELLHRRFNDLASLVVNGTVDISNYLDHEWLMNIILYILSLIPFSLYVTKFCIDIFMYVVTLKFIDRFKTHELDLNVETIFLFIFLSRTCIHIKSFTVSIAFLMLEIILLSNYGKDSFRKSFLLSNLLVVLWNNMHGASFILYFIVAFLWFVLYRRDLDKKFYLIGVSNVFSLLINPYGYKLLLHTIKMNLNKQSSVINLEFVSLDAKNLLGLVTILTIILFLYRMRVFTLRDNRLDKFFCLFLFFVIVMCVRSQRHLIYLYPIYLYIYTNTKEQFSFDIFDKQFKKVLVCLFMSVSIGFIVYGTMNNFRSSYVLYIPDDLKEMVISNGDDDLYITNPGGFYLAGQILGIKDFAQCDDMSNERFEDSYIIAKGCPDAYTSYIIDKYSLKKFLITVKDNNYPTKDGNYSSLYIYFKSKSDKYNFLYDDGEYAYVMEK